MQAWILLTAVLMAFCVGSGCSKRGPTEAGAGLASDAAQKVYVAPGKYDEFYAFLSGGFNGQLSVYGLPSGRLFKIIPVFSAQPENGYGFNEETKPMLQTSHGYVPWDDMHHTELSMTNGLPNGRWIFVNSNNTPRVARIDLKDFRTVEMLEIPNTGGNHASPFSTFNGEYVIAATRFSLPIPQKDVPIDTYRKNFRGTISFVSVNPNSGEMGVAFQILVPGIDYDLGHCGKGPSKDWCFFTSYNSEKANTLLEINASKNDKDLLAAVNWREAEKCVAQGKAKTWPSHYLHNEFDERTLTTHSEKKTGVKVLSLSDCPGVMYYMPVPKSPHGCDIDPTGEYVTAGGKLAAQVTAYSFTKMQSAIAGKKFAGTYDGVPILDYPAVLAGEVQRLCLGPLHSEFDDKGFGYTSCFISSEIVKWKVGTWEVVDRIPTYYSIGHLMVPGGDSAKPHGKYLLAMNKITKDRYLPVGPELPQASQLIDISGDKMQLLLDFPTVGEPHYAQAVPAAMLMQKSRKIYNLQEENHHPYATKAEDQTKVVRDGKTVHVYMTVVRSHLTPDNIEGVKVGDTVLFHVTNLEQDWDIPHGFAIFGAENAELLIMPGETTTYRYEAKDPGIFPFYCTDFCSALHQEMQGYLRVSEPSANVPLKWGTGASVEAPLPTPLAALAEAPAPSATPGETPAAPVKTASKGVGPVKHVELGPIDNQMADRGKAVFQAKCAACHKIEERFVGPALKGVTLRRQPEWIMNMILNPLEMTQKDPVAKDLLAKYATQMANQNASQEQAREILEFFRRNDEAGGK